MAAINIEIGVRVTVPSGLGGVWTCTIIAKANRHGEMVLQIDNSQYPDAHGKYLVRDASEVKNARK